MCFNLPRARFPKPRHGQRIGLHSWREPECARFADVRLGMGNLNRVSLRHGEEAFVVNPHAIRSSQGDRSVQDGMPWSGELVALNGRARPGVEVNTDATGVVLHGYDPVAYFTEGKPIAGDEQFSAEYGGGKYLFSTAANRDDSRKRNRTGIPKTHGTLLASLASDCPTGRIESASLGVSGRCCTDVALE